MEEIKKTEVVKLRPWHLNFFESFVKIATNRGSLLFYSIEPDTVRGDEFQSNMKEIFFIKCRKPETKIIIVDDCNDDDICQKCPFQKDCAGGKIDIALADIPFHSFPADSDEKAKKLYRVVTGKMYFIEDILKKIQETLPWFKRRNFGKAIKRYLS
jgi:hypothetical protein